MKKIVKINQYSMISKIVITIFFILVTLNFIISNSFKKEVIGEEKIYKASMIMVGDNLIHSSIYKDAYQVDGTYDFTKMYELVKPIVSNYDIAYYNQETILGGRELGISDYPRFNSPQEVGDAMIDAGFNLVSLANNHTLDKGINAVISSRNYWNSFDNVLAVGSYSSFDEKNFVYIMEKNNITYTMLNYTYGTNGISVPEGKEYLVNVWPVMGSEPVSDKVYQEYKEQVRRDITRVRDSVDLLIVAMHWGVEYSHEPSEYQKDMANFLASEGVNIVIGTHPHVIQPMEWIGDTLVIYSLGNFISAQYQDDNYNKMIGLMTSLEVSKVVVGGNVDIKIENVSNEFLYTYYNNWRDFKVIPFSSEEISFYFPFYRDVYNDYVDIVKKYDDSMFVKSID